MGLAVEQLDHPGALVGLHHPHGGHAVGVELAAVGEGGHRAHVAVGGHRGGVDRPGPAEGEHGEVPGVVSLQGGLAVDLLAHHSVDEPADPQGGLGCVDAQRVGDPAAQGPLGQPPAQRHGPAQEIVGVDVAQHHVGVGDGGLGPALGVAGRAGHRPGAAGPHPQLARVGEMGDGAPAGTDGVVGDDGQMHPPPVDHRVELVVAVLAVEHQAHVEAGAAHVGGYHPVQAVVGGHAGRAGQPGHRAAAQQVQGGGAAGRGHAPDVAGHQQRPAAADRAEPVAEVDHVVLGVGGQIGAEDGGDAAPVFVELGGHLRGQQHRAAAQNGVGVFGGDDLAHLLLVGGVHERPGEADGDGPHPLADQVIHRGQHVVGAQRHQHPAEAVDPLADPDPQRAGHQVVGAAGPGAVDLHLQGHPVGPGPGPGHVDGVLLAGGGDQPHPGAGALDQGVGAHRGGVLDHIGGGEGVGRVAAEPAGGLADGREHAVGQVGVGGGRLAHGLAAAQGHEGVGEGAPDVDVEQVRAGRRRVIRGHQAGCRWRSRGRGRVI